MGLLDGKKAVITGGTSGIGEAAAEIFAEEGAELIIVGRNADKGNFLKEVLQNDGKKADFFPCDISDEARVKELSDYIGWKWGGTDILFNNAGVLLPSLEIEKIPGEDWERTFHVNMDGMFYVTRNLKPYIFQSRGCIINNASIAGMHSYIAGKSYAYSASKAAVIQFTRQMAINYAAEGIRVNCICPGIIDTPILGDRDRKEYAKRIPMGMCGKPEDAAKAALFLASDMASYITGVVLPVDGGVSLGGGNASQSGFV